MATFPLPSFALDSNGDPVPGALLKVYLAGTSTPATIYTDSALTTPHAWPIVYDASGTPPDANPDGYSAGGYYKLDLQTAAGVSLSGYPKDNVLVGLSLTYVDDINTLLTGSTAYTEDEIIFALKEGVSYEVAASGATDHHVTTSGGVKLYVQPQQGQVALKAFGAKGDGATDDTSAIQTAVNYASNNNLTVIVEPGEYLCSKLYGYYDATNNTGFNSLTSTAGSWGLVGTYPLANANSTGDIDVGARFVSSATTGCPFEFIRPTGETNNFYARKLTLKNIAFKGATTDSAVWRTSKIQEPQFENVHVVQSGVSTAAAWICDDCDQHNIRDVLVYGPGSGNAGTAGIEIYQDDIDASRGKIDGLLVRDFESAGVIGGTMADIHDANDTMRNMVFDRLASNSCVYGFTFGGKLERCIFHTPQCRGTKRAATICGQLNSCIFDAPSFSASAPTAANDYECQLLLGHPDSTSGTRKFASVVIESPDFPSVPANTPAIRWLGRDELNGIEVRGPTALLAATTSRMVHFNQEPQGGSLMDVRMRASGFTPDFTHVIDSAGESPMGTLTDFGVVFDGKETIGWTKRNRFGGFIGTLVTAAATTDFDPAYSHVTTGTTSINSITIGGEEPVAGMQIVVRFSNALSLLSTAGGGSGSGNIALSGGDLALSANDVKTLTYAGGAWRSVV